MSKPKSLRSKLNVWFARCGLRSAHRVCGRQGVSRRLLALALQMLVVVMLNAIGFAASTPAYAQGNCDFDPLTNGQTAHSRVS